MKMISVACVIAFAIATAYAKPMTDSVESWEGQFKLQSDKIVVQTEGNPKLILWQYQLEKGSRGTCIGFSTENGDMILVPKPNAKGVQPIYAGYGIIFSGTDLVEIIVTYDIQGNGGQKLVERYTYDGKLIKLSSRSQYFGKTEPIWKDITGE